MDYYFPPSSDYPYFEFPFSSENSNFTSSSLITNTNNMQINAAPVNGALVNDNNMNKHTTITSSSNSCHSDQKVKRSKVKLSTDPQSVAARERRHRISERYKILQSMVPGGSKMDTVSMLEETIKYVKFLKNQIWLHQTMINFSSEDNGGHDQYYDCDPLTGNVVQLPIHYGYPVSRPQEALGYEMNNFAGFSSFQGQQAAP